LLTRKHVLVKHLNKLQLIQNGECLSQKVKEFTLPYSVLAENRADPFSEEMEKAAIYCFAELEREKGAGLILKKPEENIILLAEFGYPFWFVPWSRLNLIFDGLKTTFHALNYKEIPDVKVFMENLQRSSKTLETYITFLSDNINYFQMSSKEKTIAIDALVTEPSLLNEFNLYLSEAKSVESQSPETVFLSSAIDETTISFATQELDNAQLNFKEDIEILYESMKLLSKTTRSFVKTIRSEIKTVKEDFNGKIKKQKEIITPKVNRINEEYDEQITTLTKKFEHQLLSLQKEKIKLEKIREQILSKIERCKKEAETCAANKDSVRERKWKEKANESKKEFSEIEVKIEDVEEKIKEVEKNKSLETFKLRSEWEAEVKEAEKDLLELEASRDAKIQFHTQEMEKLEKLTSSIIEQIDKLAKMRETNLAAFEKLGIQQKWARNTLVYMPFYLVCYQSESKRRYVLFPPSIANSISFSAKLKGALGKARVKQLLVPRFNAITSFLNKLPTFIERNAVFERELNEVGNEASLLKTNSMREQIGNGLKKLREEGWLSEKEYVIFNQKLREYG
jgi:DNA repair exonuclease SbcCD ATPase subunit